MIRPTSRSIALHWHCQSFKWWSDNQPFHGTAVPHLWMCRNESWNPPPSCLSSRWRSFGCLQWISFVLLLEWTHSRAANDSSRSNFLSKLQWCQHSDLHDHHQTVQHKNKSLCYKCLQYEIFKQIIISTLSSVQSILSKYADMLKFHNTENYWRVNFLSF